MSTDLHSYDLGYSGAAYDPDRRSAEVVTIEFGNAIYDAGKPPGPSNILDLCPLTIEDLFRTGPADVIFRDKSARDVDLLRFFLPH